MTVGENIKRIRKQKGLTQKKLGELCEPKINEVQIRQYELGRANPKIETIDRIASALGVKIVDLMEQFTIDEYKKTSEYQKLENRVSGQKGLIAILEDIYGKVEDKDIEGLYGSGHYYLIGEGNNQFILYDGAIDALYKSTMAALQPLVDQMKDSRSEDIIVQEYLKELNSPELLDKIPEKYK